MFGLSLPYGKSRKKNDEEYVLMNDDNSFLMEPFLQMGYYLFSQNSEISLEQ